MKLVTNIFYLYEIIFEKRISRIDFLRMEETTKEYALDNIKETVDVLKIHNEEIRFEQFNACRATSKQIDEN